MDDIIKAIETIDALSAEIRAVNTGHVPQLDVALGGLQTARDNMSAYLKMASAAAPAK
jgi:hypothetical protein